jgi:hypothetical protein
MADGELGRNAGPEGLTEASRCSTFVLMEVETLGIARSLGWKVHMRCADGYREGTRSVRRCVYRKPLDLDTLVSTRGRARSSVRPLARNFRTRDGHTLCRDLASEDAIGEVAA